ncbi:MAG: adenylate/guanylate cyclase domain-containing protein [Anaerolineales bacterium]|jgi:adenylate cyclase
MSIDTTTEEKWRKMLMEGEPIGRHVYHLFGMLPSNPRCKLCAAPFKSWGGVLMRMIGREQSEYNPRFCQPCERFDNPGGAEIELTMLFADVRNSTALAEQMSAREFSQLMNRFYTEASKVLIKTDAMVDRLMGDEVIGLYIPGFAGEEHPHRAIEAARELLERTGHRDNKGPWLPVGVGVHTGPAYVGVVGGGEDNPSDFTALGDNVNVTSRLASQAGPGEILISEAAYQRARLELDDLEQRDLELKGKSETTRVRVYHINPN